MRMAVLHTNITSKGGLERVLLAIAERYDADIFTLRYDAEKTFEGFKKLNIHELGAPKNMGKIGMGALASIKFSFLKLKEYDILNPHGSPSELCALRNDDVLWYCHSPNREAFDLYEFRQRKRGLLRYVLAPGFLAFRSLDRYAVRRIKRVAVNSMNTKMKLQRYLGRDDGVVVYPFVDASEFRNEGYGKYFFYPSRIVPEKRFEMAIEAFKKAKLNGHKLIIAGFIDMENTYQRTYYEKLLRLAEGSAIEFVLNPSDDELKRLYAGCIAVLFTAVNEDFGIVPLEAMASEKPVIAINEGGPRETVSDGKTGFLVDNTEDMAKKIVILASSTSLLEEMGKEARKVVVKKFSRKAFFKKFDKLVMEVLGDD